MRQKLFTVTHKDCRWDYYKGSGAGGQKRNKTENCVRCTHVASGAVGKSEEGRSKDRNKKNAFLKMTQTKEFQDWCRLEAARASGEEAKLLEKIDRDLANPKVTKVETY